MPRSSKHTSVERRATLLRTTGLCVAYNDIQVVWDVSLEVNKGEIVALLGSNGAGKSSILKGIAGLVSPTSGSVTFEGKDLLKIPPHARTGLGVSLVPEGRELFTQLSVQENLELGAFLPRARKEIVSSLELVFTLFPVLKERSHQKAGTLSGGEQQMLAIARALMAKPKLLLLDEISNGLAPKVVAHLFDTIQKLNSAGISVLLVEQNTYEALRISHRAYVLSNGRVAIQQASKDLVNDKEIVGTYLG